MFTTRGHSDINTTPSVIMSLFCCRSLYLCIFLSCCLCLFILAVSFCLPTFIAEIFSVCSNPVSFYLPAFFAEIFSACSHPVSFCLPAFLAEIFFVCSCLSLSTRRLSSRKFCLLLLLLTGSIWRSYSLALRLLTLAFCRSLSLCSPLKSVVYTLQFLCCCLLT